MGLFGKRKYKPKQISTAYGKAPEFTTVEELPDDLRMLKGMSYYYYNNEIDKNHQYAYYIKSNLAVTFIPIIKIYIML